MNSWPSFESPRVMGCTLKSWPRRFGLNGRYGSLRSSRTVTLEVRGSQGRSVSLAKAVSSLHAEQTPDPLNPEGAAGGASITQKHRMQWVLAGVKTRARQDVPPGLSGKFLLCVGLSGYIGKRNYFSSRNLVSANPVIKYKSKAHGQSWPPPSDWSIVGLRDGGGGQVHGGKGWYPIRAVPQWF